MSNRLFQSVIHQMKDAIDRIIGVVDENGVIIACSELVKIGEVKQGIHDELSYASDVVTIGGYTYNARTIRSVGMFINSPLWIAYDIIIGSWAGILDEIATEASILLSIFRYGWKSLGGQSSGAEVSRAAQE